MNTVGAFEAKNKLGSLLDRVEAGEEILITRHGKPAGLLSPPPRQRSAEDVAPFDWAEWKAYRDEGKR